MKVLQEVNTSLDHHPPPEIVPSFMRELYQQMLEEAPIYSHRDLYKHAPAVKLFRVDQKIGK